MANGNINHSVRFFQDNREIIASFASEVAELTRIGLQLARSLQNGQMPSQADINRLIQIQMRAVRVTNRMAFLIGMAQDGMNQDERALTVGLSR